MKKCKYLLFSFIFSFVFIFNVNASTFKAKIDFNERSSGNLNLFYEFQHSTPLAQFLMEEQGNIGTTISSMYSGSGNIYDDYISIFSVKDYHDFIDSEKNFSDSVSYIFIASGKLNNFDISGNLVTFKPTYSATGGGTSCRMFFFDDDMNYIGDSSFSSITITIPINDKNITSLFNAIYYQKNSVSYSSLSYDKYVLNKIIVGNNIYTLEDNDNLNSFTSWIRDIFTTAYDDDTMNIDFSKYRKKPIIGKSYSYISLVDVLFSDSHIDIPDNWVKLNISNYANGYYLIPTKSSYLDVCPSGNNCTDLGFYVIKTNNSQNIMLGSLDYETGQAVYNGNYTYYQNVFYPYKTYFILDGFLTGQTSAATKYPTMIYQFYTDYSAYDSFVYYNPEYFTSKPANVTGSEVIDVLGQSVTLPSSSVTAADIKSGAAADINFNGDISDLGEYIKAEGITPEGLKDGFNELYDSSDIMSMSKNAVSNLTSFAGSFMAVGSMSKSILDSLPDGVANVLWFAFITGILIIIIKIIL